MKVWHRYVPITVPFIQNINFDDFLNVQHMVGNKEILASINWATYFLLCYEEYVYFGRNGFIKNRKVEFLTEWERALSTFDQNVQKTVHRQLWKIKIKSTLKAILAQSSLLPSLRRLRSGLIYRGETRHCDSALEAAGFSGYSQ